MPPPSQDVIPEPESKENKKFKTKSSTQQPKSTPPVPILSQKLQMLQTQPIIDLTDDDDDKDFVQTIPAMSQRSGKKLKLI